MAVISPRFKSFMNKSGPYSIGSNQIGEGFGVDQSCCDDLWTTQYNVLAYSHGRDTTECVIRKTTFSLTPG